MTAPDMVTALAHRVRALEAQVTALLGKGGPGRLVDDASVIAAVAEALGVAAGEVTGGRKRPEAVAARRVVVKALRERFAWSWARIARAVGCDVKRAQRLAAGR